jgi:pyruvate, water dikinase
MNEKFILWFDEVDKHDIPLVGGKGANLGEMTKASFPIPFGFIVSSKAYFYFLKKQQIKERIDSLLKHVDVNDPNSLHEVSKKVRALIVKTPIPPEISSQIATGYEQIYEREKRSREFLSKIKHRLRASYSPPLVAVRSSATAEDLPDASFAGQQETFLNVKGENNLLRMVRECWASLFTERAIFYRTEKKFDHFKVGLAAVVQRMVQSDKSGIMFTVDPVTNDKNIIVIEAIYGLGEYIVQGKVTPDQYLVNKKDLSITKKKVNYQNLKFVKAGTNNKEVKLSKKEGEKAKLSKAEIQKIAELGKKIEKHYFFPQDLEWAIEGRDYFIVQSRPITTLQGKSQPTAAVSQAVFLEGDPASPGIATGKIVLIKSVSEIGKIKPGDILLASATNPDYVPAMKKASAIITEHGGRTSHAAIVSRELGIACVVGVKDALAKIKEGEVLTVNGANGKIYKGTVEIKQKEVSHKHYKTKTKIYLNLAEPDRAEDLAKLPVDGIGLLRAEFMIANIGEHPKSLLKKNKAHVFVNRLKHDLAKVCQAFYPRPVVYRATDFKTNEYRFLKGGKSFEPVESNPMLGYRGTFRYISEPEVFALEVKAIQKVRQQGLDNLHIMFPYVVVPEHLKKAKELVQQSGLRFGRNFRVWMMVELPVNVIMLEEFLKIGVHGVSIGSNDLTMLTLGVDRDNETVASLFDERNKAIYWALKRTISVCNNLGITSSICGQSISDYPEILETVVKNGITSVSVNHDAVYRINEAVYHLEQRQ